MSASQLDQINCNVNYLSFGIIPYFIHNRKNAFKNNSHIKNKINIECFICNNREYDSCDGMSKRIHPMINRGMKGNNLKTSAQ